MTRSHAALFVFLGAGVAAGAFAGCGSDPDPTSVFPDAGPDAIDDVLVLTDSSPLPDAGPTEFNDFPPPIVVGGDGGPGAPQNAPTLFGDVDGGATDGGGAGPCLVEPEIGSLYPRNWLRPRFRWNATGGQNLFELRLHVDNQKTDLLVYTVATQWTMPKVMWDALRQNSADVPMTLTVRGGVWNGTALSNVAVGSTGPIGIAPAEAPGAIVYWWIKSQTGLKGFTVGDETVVPALTSAQVKQRPVTCIGCHSGSPTGEDVILSAPPSAWANVAARIDPAADAGVGSTPPFAGTAGLAALAQGTLGITSMSKSHWQPGDRVVVGSDGTNLVWIDVEATTPGAARGTIARTGTAPAAGTLAGAPSFSHDGKNIVYVATNRLTDGRLGGFYQSQTDNGSRADLFVVPYANRAGGAITPLTGANDPNVQEYYPAYSPDDSLVAFNRAPNDRNMYNQSQAELYVISSQGGTPVRLAANDPPACSGKTSPGVTNSWPKWAPNVETVKGKTYYWIVFSSVRLGANPQLFISPVVVENGQAKTYAALYLWNQPADEGNHTPAWEFFKLPPPPPPN